MTDAAYNTWLFNFSYNFNCKVKKAEIIRDSRIVAKRVHTFYFDPLPKMCEPPELCWVKTKTVNKDPGMLLINKKPCRVYKVKNLNISKLAA